MAVDLTVLGQTSNITLSATANNVTEVDLPEFANKIVVQFIGADGKMADTGVDGQPIGGTYLTIQQDTLVEIEIYDRPGNTNRQTKYFASATSSTVMQILPLRSSLR